MSLIFAFALMPRAKPSPVVTDGFVVYLYTCPVPPVARMVIGAYTVSYSLVKSLNEMTPRQLFFESTSKSIASVCS